MQSTQLQPGSIIEGPFWPEPLRILSVKETARRMAGRLLCTGSRTTAGR